MKKLTVFFIIFLILIASQVFAGTVYYVDARNGNDSNNGLSQAAAWKTLAKVSRSAFSPGDSILFKRGEVWREPKGLEINGYNGTPGARIIFGAYGSGDRPIINGASIETGWIYSGWGKVYEKSFTNEVRVVVEDDTVLTKVLTWKKDVATTFASASAGSWSWDGTKCYVWCTDGAAPDTHTMEVAAKSRENKYGILVKDNNYITFEGLDIRYMAGVGILIRPKSGNDANYALIKNCNVHGCGEEGVKISNVNNSSTGTHEITGHRVTNCSVYENRYHGIHHTYEVINGTVDYNTVYDNSWDNKDGWHGISQWSDNDNAKPVGNIIEYNTVYNTHTVEAVEGNGIQCDGKTTNSIVRYNVCYNNEGAGIAVNSASSCNVYYNICYDNNMINNEWLGGVVIYNSTDTNIYYNIFKNNKGNGVSIVGTASNNTSLKNNIIFQSDLYEIRIDANAGKNFSSNYNCIYHSDGVNFLRRASKEYDWNSWQRLGYDISSVNGCQLRISCPDNGEGLIKH